jgi:hypothetical protein
MFSKMDWNKVDRYGGVVLLCVFFGYIFYQAYRQTNELAYKARYTVGEIIKFSMSGHLIKKIDYKFYVNEVEYIRRENYQGGEIGRRYYVKFSSQTPTYSDFLQDVTVPDSIKAVPPEGWEEIPK